MPSVEENLRMWNQDYPWEQGGDEWSRGWGSPDMQWYGTLWPRLRSWLPRPVILEIGPGHGRWTQYLKELCERLILVDLSETCIRACRERFAGLMHLEYFVTDGRSLHMIPDGSVDFVFSFGSLVHAEADVFQAYLRQLFLKLKDGGLGMIHHSNIGNYRRYFRFMRRFPFRRLLARMGLVEPSDHWRAYSMTHQRFAQLAHAAGLCCVGQELITCATRRLIDCISYFAKRSGRADAPPRVLCNPSFDAEAARLRWYWELGQAAAPVNPPESHRDAT
jgi:SAM-dependent methyltransferase